jgi:hypothetical protein
VRLSCGGIEGTAPMILNLAAKAGRGLSKEAGKQPVRFMFLHVFEPLRSGPPLRAQFPLLDAAPGCRE